MTTAQNRDSQFESALIGVAVSDVAVRNSLRFSLQIEGFRVRAYADANELLSDPNMPLCDCFVIDQNMPGIGGLDLLAALGERSMPAPVILLSGRVNPALLQRAARAKVSIIEKPLLGNGLVDAIRAAVAQATNRYATKPELQATIHPQMQQGATMIKDILVNLSVGATRDVAAEYALSVASTLDAHLAAVAIAYEPVIPGTIFDGVYASVIAQERTERELAARTAIKRFDEAAKRAGLSVEPRMVTGGVTAAAEAFSRLARNFGLAIVSQAKPEDFAPEEFIIETTLFGSGRPILVVPYIQSVGLKLDRAVACWDGSRNAARAIADAMPLLARSKTVEILTIATKERRGELAGVDTAQHLARHGLKIELKNIVATDTDVANTILSHVADTSADFIVMGGYGHSRLREFVLGGATRGILASMTVPVLLSH